MSNLIVTVIAIALVAVAAVTGAYYGGSAFMQGKVNATANIMISQAEQIASAWTIYAANNGGDQNPPGNAANFQFLVDQGFLSSIPKTPMEGSSGRGTGNAMNFGKIIAYRLYSSGDYPAYPQNAIIFYWPISDGGDVVSDAERDFNFKVCTKIASIAYGVDVTQPSGVASDGGSADYYTNKFNCYWNDRNGDGNYDPDQPDATGGQEILLFWYKVFPII